MLDWCVRLEMFDWFVRLGSVAEPVGAGTFWSEPEPVKKILRAGQNGPAPLRNTEARDVRLVCQARDVRMVCQARDVRLVCQARDVRLVCQAGDVRLVCQGLRPLE